MIQVQVLDRGFWVNLEQTDDAEKVGRLVGMFPGQYRAIDPETGEPLPLIDATALPSPDTLTIEIARWSPAMLTVLFALIEAAES